VEALGLRLGMSVHLTLTSRQQPLEHTGGNIPEESKAGGGDNAAGELIEKVR
jgi:hypothetical protein